jgi:hypothetical protein
MTMPLRTLIRAHQVRVAARSRILAVLKRFDVLIRVTGTDGYIVRYAGPADCPPFREYYRAYGRGEDPKRPGLGTCAYRGKGPYADLVWLGNSSRDAYDGVLFGRPSLEKDDDCSGEHHT